MDSVAEPRLSAPGLPAPPALEHYSVLHCTMTLDVQTVVVFAVIALLLLVNVVLMFFLGTR
ncbi:small integral membrane protein 39 [Erythrolamprus reginae]|uniref:small integral membrane protein 39 n=1 Tax=Erythrolamprus reginae TaxID=121349 RepID=UPI00396C8672